MILHRLNTTRFSCKKHVQLTAVYLRRKICLMLKILITEKFKIDHLVSFMWSRPQNPHQKKLRKSQLIFSQFVYSNNITMLQNPGRSIHALISNVFLQHEKCLKSITSKNHLRS